MPCDAGPEMAKRCNYTSAFRQRHFLLTGSFRLGRFMAYSESVADRVRRAITTSEGLSERKMFGGLCLMFNGNMFAGVIGDELMLRVGTDRFEELLAQPGARPMDFTGRPMKGYLFVAPIGFASDEDLSRWIAVAHDFVDSLLPKKPGSASKKR